MARAREAVDATIVVLDEAQAEAILAAASVLGSLAEVIRQRRAAHAAHVAMAAAAQPRVSVVSQDNSIYQVSVPGLLAGALRATPSAARHLSQQFREATIVNRGRGTTHTITLRSRVEAQHMLAALNEASERITHRDIVRAAAELRVELGGAA